MTDEHAKNFIDVTSVGTVIATFAGWLPSIAALFTIIWTVIRIVETETVRKIIARLRK